MHETLPLAQLLPVAAERLQAGGLHVVEWGKGPRVSVAQAKNHLVGVGYYGKLFGILMNFFSRRLGAPLPYN